MAAAKTGTWITRARNAGASPLELALERFLASAGIGEYVRELRFHPKRKWRFDFAFPGKLAVECEGGTWTRGAHTRGAHYASDCRKYNAAALMGWRVLRFTREMIASGEALETIQEALHGKRTYQGRT